MSAADRPGTLRSACSASPRETHSMPMPAPCTRRSTSAFEFALIAYSTRDTDRSDRRLAQRAWMVAES